MDGLKRSGYVERVPDPLDPRPKQVSLTTCGLSVRERAGAILAELQAAWAHRRGGAR